MQSHPTFSDEVMIPQEMLDLPCTNIFLCRLLDLDHESISVSGTALSTFLKGNKKLTPDKLRAVRKKLAECREIRESGGGLPVAFSNAELIHNIIVERRRLKRDAPREQFFSVLLENKDGIRSYFAEKEEATGLIFRTRFSNMAQGMRRHVAEALVQVLRANYPQACVVMNPAKGLDESQPNF